MRLFWVRAGRQTRFDLDRAELALEDLADRRGRQAGDRLLSQVLARRQVERRWRKVIEVLRRHLGWDPAAPASDQNVPMEAEAMSEVPVTHERVDVNLSKSAPLTGVIAQEFDRGAADRILARAVHLSTSAATAPGRYDESMLFSVADDLGIDSSAIRQAIDEERAGLLVAPAKPGLASTIAGPAIAVAERVIAHPDAMARAEAWLTKSAGMRRQRLSVQEGLWERRSDPLAKVGRVVRVLGPDKELGELSAVHIRAITVSGGTLLRCTADLGEQRVGWLTAGGAIAAAGVTATGIGAVVAGPVLLVMLPVAPALGGFVAAQHRRRVRSTEKTLERLLDRVANDSVPNSALSRVERVVGKAVDAGSRAVDRQTRKRQH